MKTYYRKRLYDPKAEEAFKLSRSKIDLFTECPRCFYLDRRLGISRPPSLPFSLNAAVDHLLKKEFDIHRKQKTPHPLMDSYGIDAIPFDHGKIDEWRDSLKRGIQFFHEPTNLVITGGIDDLWQNSKNELIIVDYKATSKDSEVNLDAEWQEGYKRQMEIYQWLFRRNDFKVSDTGYFVYVNGKRDREAFDGRLEFDVKLIPYAGSDKWVEKTLFEIKETLDSGEIPKASPTCDYCKYINAINKAMK